VAIIAVLISVLLPALSAAREAARRATCQSNYRQVGTAMQYYRDENNGRLYPPSEYRVQYWHSIIDPYVGGKGMAVHWHAITSPVWICPTNCPQALERLALPPSGSPNYDGSWPCEYTGVVGTIALSQLYERDLTRPSQLLYLIEVRTADGRLGPATFMSYAGYGYAAGWQYSLHDRGTMALFADLHAEFLAEGHPALSAAPATAGPYWYPKGSGY